MKFSLKFCKIFLKIGSSSLKNCVIFFVISTHLLQLYQIFFTDISTNTLLNHQLTWNATAIDLTKKCKNFKFCITLAGMERKLDSYVWSTARYILFANNAEKGTNGQNWCERKECVERDLSNLWVFHKKLFREKHSSE